MSEFNFNTLEADIARLGREVKELRAHPENKDKHEREIVKHILRPAVHTNLGSSVPKLVAEPTAEEAVLPNYAEDFSPEIKLHIEQLVQDTLRGGVEKTIGKLSKYEPSVIDAYHDALTDKLYDELKKRNLI